MTRAAVVALTALVAAGCGRSRRPSPARDGGAPPPVAIAPIDAAPVREVVILRQVKVDVVAPSGAHAPAKDSMVARLSRLGDGAIATAADKPAGWGGRFGTLHATLTYDLGGTPRAPTVLMTVEAAIDLGEMLGVAARAAGEQAITAAGRAAAVDELAATLLDQVATELTNKLTVRAGTAAELAATATDTDPELAAWALELGGERHDPGLRAAASAALHQAPRLRTAAIQYLVALGDPSAVSDLAASVDFGDPDELAAIIEAVTSLGGQEARDFLEMMAAGATDADLAERAREGLRRLDRKEDAGR